MTKEFKKIINSTEIRYVLENSSAGSISSASVASNGATPTGILGELQRRIQDLKAKTVVPSSKPRNPMGMGPTPGRGTEKHKANQRQQERDRKKMGEGDHMDHEVDMAQADTYQLAKQSIALHKLLHNVSELQGLQGWQQSKITKAADYINSVYNSLEHDVTYDGEIDEQGVAEGENIGGERYDKMADLKGRTVDELNKLIQKLERTVANHPDHTQTNEYLVLAKMIRAEKIGKKGMAEGIEQMLSTGHKIIANRKTSAGDFVVLQNKNDGKYEIHKFVGPASKTGYEFKSAHKTPEEMQVAFKKLTGVNEQGVGEAVRVMGRTGQGEPMQRMAKGAPGAAAHRDTTAAMTKQARSAGNTLRTDKTVDVGATGKYPDKQVMKYQSKDVQQGVAEAGFPGAPDVEMPPMKPGGDPQRDKLKQEYMNLHREIKSLVDIPYSSNASPEQKMQAKARIKQLNDRADQIKAILEPRQPPNEWQKKEYGYDDNWNIVKKGVAESEYDQRQKMIALISKTKGWDRSDLELMPTQELADLYNDLKSENQNEGKIKGVDGKACWKGKRYAGREKKADGTYKDICIPVKEDAYFHKLNAILSDKLK